MENLPSVNLPNVVSLRLESVLAVEDEFGIMIHRRSGVKIRVGPRVAI